MARRVRSVIRSIAAALLLFPVLPATSCGTVVTRITPEISTGTIRGHLSFPGEYLPAQRIVAFDSGTLRPVASVDTDEGQAGYSLQVPRGSYVVVAYALDPEYSDLCGGYSAAVPAGLVSGLEDHSLIAVEVETGSVASGVDPADWYAPEGSFPPEP